MVSKAAVDDSGLILTRPQYFGFATISKLAWACLSPFRSVLVRFHRAKKAGHEANHLAPCNAVINFCSTYLCMTWHIKVPGEHLAC
jgi:hypothetical protein